MINLFRKYIKSLKELANTLPLDKKVYVEGSTVSNISYHAAQSTNNFLRVHVLRLPFGRNKDAEYGEQHTLDEINKSLDLALEACDLVDAQKPDMNEKLINPIEIRSGNFTLENNMGALVFGLAHLAEHVGELNQVGREVKS